MNGLPQSNVWLVVEDDDNDFLLFRRACSLAVDPVPLIYREANGNGAKAFLISNPTKAKLVVSDLKMPQCNGFQLLEWVRQHPSLKQLRFVILSSSGAEHDIKTCRLLGADDYFVKPSGLKRLAEVIKKLDQSIQ
ncbi:MAG: response regulator [Verrucomicrobiia bacterium]